MVKAREYEDDIPTYEESIQSHPPDKSYGSTTTTTIATPLHRHLDASRLHRIHSLLSHYVTPLLSHQASAGLYSTVFVLIPSNVTSVSRAQNGSSAPELIGFPSSAVVQLVWLEGEDHTVEFWRQPAVLRELESELRARLAASGHVLATDETPGATTEAQAMSSRDPQSKRRSLWGRLTGGPSDAVIVDRKLGWRADHVETGRGLLRDQVRAGVEWKEVCLRVENALGLYENCHAPGICLSVEVGE
ncbi:hypothetical protein BDV28DRAFT_127543 [Aspergillus coremiiformis]|uniref:Uncharacterized protein n=1 Tax=Aspergillus coremiiformis TaxID=138285 RepID=A0A5N6ZFC8_9EURO|nr:hypothetical protein BDV28DRAFT_127543 [Aspergillus coremiiformis]